MIPQQRSPYTTPAAFRRAVTDRLRTVAAPNSPWPLADLQRQFAYDRLLARLYLLDDGWILKGATALLARHIAVRHTLDLDVYRATSRHQAERDLRTALTLDVGDWFGFEAGQGTSIADGAAAFRIPIVARLGTNLWASFHVDLVADGIRMTGTPDGVPTLTTVDIPGLAQPRYLAYPLTDHIADKTCGILERHGPAGRPSTRFKDLLDLVILTAHAEVPAEAQRYALTSEADRRRITLPKCFDVPDKALWERGYAAEARRAVAPIPRSLQDALAHVRPFLDPLLDSIATGTWRRSSRTWESLTPDRTPGRTHRVPTAGCGG